jgi:hypothetical protein
MDAYSHPSPQVGSAAAVPGRALRSTGHPLPSSRGPTEQCRVGCSWCSCLFFLLPIGRDQPRLKVLTPRALKGALRRSQHALSASAEAAASAPTIAGRLARVLPNGADRSWQSPGLQAGRGPFSPPDRDTAWSRRLPGSARGMISSSQVARARCAHAAQCRTATRYVRASPKHALTGGWTPG